MSLRFGSSGCQLCAKRCLHWSCRSSATADLHACYCKVLLPTRHHYCNQSSTTSGEEQLHSPHAHGHQMVQQIRAMQTEHTCLLPNYGTAHAHACHQRTTVLAASTGILANSVLHTPATARHPVPPHKFKYCFCLPMPACKSAVSGSSNLYRSEKDCACPSPLHSRHSRGLLRAPEVSAQGPSDSRKHAPQTEGICLRLIHQGIACIHYMHSDRPRALWSLKRPAHDPNAHPASTSMTCTTIRYAAQLMIAARMLKELGVVIEHLNNSSLAQAEGTYFSPSAIRPTLHQAAGASPAWKECPQ